MKILIITQKLDSNDHVLGAIVGWVKEIAKISQSVSVICLEKRSFSFPKNVSTYSLGKEDGVSRLKYINNFYKHLKELDGSYDRVFVHMNQEYILLAGWYWNLKGIPVYFWRNHPNGNFLTNIAVFFSKKVFCTSKASYTAKFKKTVLMPAGVDTDLFKPVEGVVRKKYSVCMVSRIAPVKRIELGLSAMKILISSGTQVSLDIIGSPLDRDLEYFNELKKYVVDNDLSGHVNFLGDFPLPRHPELYTSYEICLNLTLSGSFDKSIISTTSCGSVPLVSNSSLSGLLPPVCVTNDSPEEIAKSLKKLLVPIEQVKIQKDLEFFVKSQSLEALIGKLQLELK